MGAQTTGTRSSLPFWGLLGVGAEEFSLEHSGCRGAVGELSLWNLKKIFLLLFSSSHILEKEDCNFNANGTGAQDSWLVS